MKVNSFALFPPRKHQEGSAVFIVMALLMIMVVLAMGNTATLNRLRQRMKIVDQRQTRRLASYSTNALAGATPTASSPDSK